MHQLQLQNIKQTYDSKIKLNKNKSGMKNEKMFEAVEYPTTPFQYEIFSKGKFKHIEKIAFGCNHQRR